MIEVPAILMSKKDRIAFKNQLATEVIIDEQENELTEIFDAIVLSGMPQKTNTPNIGTAYGNEARNNEQEPSYYFVRVRRLDVDEKVLSDPFLAKTFQLAKKIINMHPLGVLVSTRTPKPPQEGDIWQCRYLSEDRRGILLMNRTGVSKKFLSLAGKKSLFQQGAGSWSKQQPNVMSDYGSPPRGSQLSPQTLDLSNEPPYVGGGLFERQLALFSSNNNWRGNQPTLKQLEWLLDNKGIERVIRLNGTGAKRDATPPDAANTYVTWEMERALCEKKGVEWMFKSAQKEPYKPGLGYVESKKEILPILAKGNCYLHCRNGADRTGYLAASYRKEYERETNLEALWEYAIKFNSWGGANGRCCTMWADGVRNRGYAKYLDGFYPLDQWCKSTTGKRPSNRSGCYACTTGLRELGFVL